MLIAHLFRLLLQFLSQREVRVHLGAHALLVAFLKNNHFVSSAKTTTTTTTNQ